MAYSIEMWRALNRSLQMESRFFKKYLDEHYPGVYEEIKNEMTKLELDIKFKARYKRNYYTELGKFNELRDEYRLLNKSIEQFRKLYKKYKK